MQSHNPNQERDLSSIDGICLKKFAPVESHPSTARVRGTAANYYIKIIGAGCFALLVFAQLSNIGSTVSYFSDVESSLGNFFVADPVYFTVTASSTSPIMLAAGESLAVMTMTRGGHSDTLQYQVTATTTAGDPALCGAVEALATEPFPYDGPLANLATGLTTQEGPWALTLSLPPGAQVTPNSSCSIDLVYQAWNASSTPGQGFTDVEKVPLTLLSPAAPPTDSSTVSTDDASTTDTSSTPTITVPDTTTDATSTVATSTPDIAPPATDATSSDQTAPTPPDNPPAGTPPADISSQPPPDDSTPPPADASTPADTPVPAQADTPSQ